MSQVNVILGYHLTRGMNLYLTLSATLSLVWPPTVTLDNGCGCVQMVRRLSDDFDQ